VFYVVTFRTLKSFEAVLKRGGKGTDYVLATEMLVMMNVVIDFKNQVSSQILFIEFTSISQ